MGVAEKTKIGTIDLSPTWTAILPVLLHALADGSPLSKRIANEELVRMAALADAAVATRKVERAT